MIGDRDKRQTAGLCSGGHFAQGVLSITRRRVHVQVATQVASIQSAWATDEPWPKCILGDSHAVSGEIQGKPNCS